MYGLVLLLAGCSPREVLAPHAPVDSGLTADPCLADPAAVSVGTGETEFVPLEDGDPVVVINGPQGGQHILGSLRTWNTDAVVAVHYTLTLALDGELISDQTYRFQMFPEGDCRWVYPGMLGYLGFVYEEGEGILKRDVIMRMEVEDTGGRTAADQVTVVPISE